MQIFRKKSGAASLRAGRLRVLGLWGCLWIAPFLLIGATIGLDNAYAAIGLFFSKMAVVTFGGAYAVLAYVAQQAVETYHWLKPGECSTGWRWRRPRPGRSSWC